MFAERLKTLRNSMNLTQKQLAQELVVGQGATAMWETGNREPSIETIIKIANFFGVTTDYLLGLSDKPLYEHIIERDGQEARVYTTTKEAPTLQEVEDFDNAPEFTGEIDPDVKAYIDFLYEKQFGDGGKKDKG